MATIKTLLGNVKGKDGGGYEEVVLYDGDCSACIKSNIITDSHPMIELSDSIENYKSIRIEYITYDGRGKGEGLICNLPIVVSVDYIKTTYGYNAITTGVTGSNSSNFSFGFYNDKHLAQTWANHGSLPHNISHITVTGIRDKVSDAEKNFNKYSTTEEVVGTWIDGKPLYRKTMEFSNVSAGENAITHGLQNIELLMVNKTWSFIIDERGTVSIWQLGNSNENATNFSQYSCNVVWTNTSAVSIYIGSGLNPKKLIITFEYTKTTD